MTNDEMDERLAKSISVESKQDEHGKKTRVSIDTADWLAIGAMIAAVIIALGMVFGKVDAKIGAGLLVALCGGAWIARVIGAKARKKG